MLRTLIAIDPGASGGIACRTINGDIESMKMPLTIKDLHDVLHEFATEYDNPIVLMEKVGKHRLGNSAQSSATFAKHVGHLEALLIANGLPCHEVNAAKWMNDVVPLRPKGIEPHVVRARKNYIKDLMQRHRPKLKVTLATADALGILEHFIRTQDQY